MYLVLWSALDIYSFFDGMRLRSQGPTEELFQRSPGERRGAREPRGSQECLGEPRGVKLV